MVEEDQPASGAAPCVTGPRGVASYVLGDDPQAVPRGRRFVADEVARLGGADAGDAALVAAELLANAVQHGAPPVLVAVAPDRGGVRVEVRDTSPRSPVRAAHSTTNMTGRGLTLVEALSAAWGVRREPDGGKTVWALLSDSLPEAAADDADVDTILAQWDDEADAVDGRYTVVLGDVPTDLLIEAKAHIDNLVREFSLAAAGGGDEHVPRHLATLIDTVVHGFSDARDAIKRQALAAAGRGEQRTALTLHLPVSAADAGEAYLAALDEADSYARAARLLTLETPAEHRLFRRWYVRGVVDQLRRVAAGGAPEPLRAFDLELVDEVRRLSAAQRVSDRGARLQRVTSGLARARTPEDVADTVVSEAVAALGASGGGLLVPAADGEHLAVPGTVGYGEEFVGQLRAERLDAPLPAATAIRTGEAVWLEGREEIDRRFPELRGFEAGTLAMCAVPLLVGERTIGALRYSFSSRRIFDEDERAFVLALAAVTAATLHRTELYQAERHAAVTLQRALLPERLVAVPGWDVAAYYSPAGDQEVGGDFYDVIDVGAGRIAAVVGDVMGRGIEAAAAMGQIRSTIRAYALDDPDPASVFQRVDAYFDALSLSQLVTVLYVLADSTSQAVHFGSAGHLPPLLVDGHGSRLVPTRVGLPFGVAADERVVTPLPVPPGAALVVITDGLVERHGEDIDEGLARLVNGARMRPEDTAQNVLDRVVAAAAGERSHDDDVTVLVLRREEDGR